MLYVADPDGTGEQEVVPSPDKIVGNPHWSPSGTKFAFFHESSIWTMDADGTGHFEVTSSLAGFDSLDWGPTFGSGYPRPKAASPVRVPLVTAFYECGVYPQGAPNRTHGPPLAYPSCNPPVTPSAAKLGTPDATATPAKGIGFVRYRTIVGVPGGVDDTDVAISVDITDVLCRRPEWAVLPTCGQENNPPGSNIPEDYVGELSAAVDVRITDKDNGASPEPGTVSDTSFSVTVPCADNTDGTIGSTCSVATTADAVVPGSIKEGKRAIWELGQVIVNDGGLDGDVETSPEENRAFLRQGVFVP
jgi:hypothetical protein